MNQNYPVKDRTVTINTRLPDLEKSLKKSYKLGTGTMSGSGKFVKKGQGKGKCQAKGGTSNAHANKMSVTEHNYYLGSAKQASDYETTTEFLINHVKKVFDYG